MKNFFCQWTIHREPWLLQIFQPQVKFHPSPRCRSFLPHPQAHASHSEERFVLCLGLQAVEFEWRGAQLADSRQSRQLMVDRQRARKVSLPLADLTQRELLVTTVVAETRSVSYRITVDTWMFSLYARASHTSPICLAIATWHFEPRPAASVRDSRNHKSLIEDHSLLAAQRPLAARSSKTAR